MAEGSDLTIVRRLWRFARPDRGLYALALALAPLSIGLSMVQPLLLKEALDAHVTPGIVEGLSAVAGMYLATVLGGFALEAVYVLSLATAGQRSLVRVREAVYRHLISRSARFFNDRPAGALLTRATTDIEAMAEALQSGLLSLLLDALRVLGALAAMIWLDWRLTLVLLAVAPPLLLVLEICRRNLRRLFTIIRDSLATLNGFLAERLAGVEVVQLFNHEASTGARFRSLNTTYRDATVRSNVWDATMFAIVDGVGSMCVALMLWCGSSDWLSGAISAGLLAAFIDYLDRLFQPLRQFSQQVAVIQRSLTAMEKIFSLLDDQTAISPGGATLAAPPRGHVRFEDVRFGYAEGQDVICGVSFEVRPGQSVALVGPTGCGKTTLTRLLTRTYGGYRGRITIDGQEVSSLDPAEVRRHVAAVHQDVHLFPDTLRFNISMGAERTDAELEAAAKVVQADGFIRELGWSRAVEERGANLSVGQAQLITFARAMAYAPEVVVLDEATASVDPVTEAQIQAATENILAQKTAIVVAHRLSTITAADEILVLDAGQIIERGTHEALLAAGGRYAALYAQGFGSEGSSAP